ncbi:hypothetical protein RUND412_000364 [Rhizina undulata]
MEISAKEMDISRPVSHRYQLRRKRGPDAIASSAAAGEISQTWEPHIQKINIISTTPFGPESSGSPESEPTTEATITDGRGLTSEYSKVFHQEREPLLLMRKRQALVNILGGSKRFNFENNPPIDNEEVKQVPAKVDTTGRRNWVSRRVVRDTRWPSSTSCTNTVIESVVENSKADSED